MKRFFKYLLLLPLGLGITLLTAILISLLWFPQLVINQWSVTQSLQLVDRYVLPITWRQIDVEARSISLWNKSLSLQIDGLCFGLNEVTFCGEDLSFASELHIRPGNVAINHIGPVSLLGLVIEVRQVEAESEQDEAGLPDEPLRPLIWIQRLEDLSIDALDLSLDRLHVLSPENETLVDLNGRFTLTGLNRHLRSEEQQSTDRASLRLAGTINQQAANLEAAFELADYQRLTDDLASVDSRLSGRWLEHRIEASINLSGQQAGEFRQASSRIRYHSDFGNFRLDGRGRLRQGQFSGQLDANASEIMEQIFDLELKPCGIQASWGDRLVEPIQLNLNCSGLAKHHNAIDMNAELSRFLPSQISFQFSIDGDYRLGAESDAYQLLAKLVIDEVKNGGLSLSGNMQAQIEKDFGGASPDLNLDLDFKAAIERFEALVEQLAETDWSIPAPINQLRGNSLCRVRGQYVSAMERDQFPISCETNLSSPRQALETRLDGRLELIKSAEGIQPHLDADFEIVNIEIALPDFTIGQQVPKVAPDKRFVLEERPRRAEDIWQRTDVEVEPPAEMNFSYEIRLRSARDDAIRLHSNLLRTPLPLSANLDLTSERGMQGRISLQDYRVELFRREALVQNVAMHFEFDREDHPISGRVLFDTTDYSIQLVILGTAEAPSFVLESTPPLPEQDLYAILLFGSRPEALDSDKVRSLDETRAAITDGAIGLLSMYYLASTPIESVGYNPHDRMFTARVTLQEGLTLTVGTGAAHVGQVGLRKRIGQNWSVETRALSGDDQRAGRAVAMLRWGLRY